MRLQRVALVHFMRIQTALAPGQPDVTVHIVLNDFGAMDRAYVETDEADADEATIVDYILSGQYSHPLRVIAFNTAEGWSRTPRRIFWRGCWEFLYWPNE
jgi:hypothetical protein